MNKHSEPVGVKTNGINQRTTAHLNLTRSMAEDIEIRKFARRLSTREEVTSELQWAEPGRGGRISFAGSERGHR